MTLVDISQDVLDKSAARIGESIKRVAKKEHKDDQVKPLNFTKAFHFVSFNSDEH